MKGSFGVFILLMTFVSCGTFSNTGLKMKESTYLALGDSYTIGESISKENCFPELLVRALKLKKSHFQSPEIIARTGWRTDQLITAIEQGELESNYDLVTLLIGVNNEFQGESVAAFEIELNTLCHEAIRLAGGKKSAVYVISIPDYGFTPSGKKNQEKISKRIDEYNNVAKKITESIGLKFIDVTLISREGLIDSELVAFDGLHPSVKMYNRWVEKLVLVILTQD